MPERSDRLFRTAATGALPILTSLMARSVVSGGMWSLVRTLLFAFAMAGFVGQATAQETPFEAAAAMAGMRDCPEMTDAADTPLGKPASSCCNMTSDCIAKMGCATVAAPLPPRVDIARPLTRRAMTFVSADTTRDGSGPSPLHFPPKRLA